MTPATMSVGNSTLVTKCLEFCQALTSQGTPFTFSLDIGSDFSFYLYTRVSSTSPEVVKKKLSPSAMRRNARRKEAFLKRKSEALKKSDNNLEVETSSQVEIFLCDQCDQSFKTKNGLRIHVGKSHKDNIPQLDGQNEDITADLVLQTCPIKKPEAIKSETQTDSPCECMKYCGEYLKTKMNGRFTCLKSIWMISRYSQKDTPDFSSRPLKTSRSYVKQEIQTLSYSWKLSKN
jgi:hypothetical protein